MLQTALNPGDGGPEVQRFGWTFRIGDRVIQTENDYNRDVFNGDLGVIEKINRIEQEMVGRISRVGRSSTTLATSTSCRWPTSCRSTRARGRSFLASSFLCTRSIT